MMKVAIVGAGPAGASTALFLLHARPELAGRVALIDRAHFPRDKICAGAVGGRALRALAEIGVELEVPRVEVFGLGVVTDHGALSARRPETIGWVTRRRDLDAALVHEAVGRGAVLLQGAKLRGLTRGTEGVRLETSAGSITAEVVVGADGVGSATRRLLGLDRSDVHAQAVEVDTRWHASDRQRDVLWFDLTEGPFWGYAWEFPTLVDGRPLVCRGVYRIVRGPEALARRPDPAALLEARLSRMGVSAVGRTRRFAERGLPLHAPLSVERALLVGEAAGIDPVLGEGIAQAILYGALAGRYLARRPSEHHFGDWRATVMRSRLGWDLRARRALLPLLYGSRTRPLVERWVSRSEALAHGGAAYFGGDRVPRAGLGRAAVDLLLSLW